jgi:NCS1 family nucleobase:cation symporter-1
MLALCIATLATNIAANVVSPANDFAHLAPRRISFRIGGLITGLIGIAMMPWKLVADPSGYVFTWLLGYSALLGPIGGIMIADYFVLRRTRLDLAGLYDAQGPYRYTGGWSLVAVAAFLLGALPNLPGFLAQVGLLDPAHVLGVFLSIYSFAWFSGFGIAFFAYLALRKLAPLS